MLVQWVLLVARAESVELAVHIRVEDFVLPF
jgi:hypothetical protein